MPKIGEPQISRTMRVLLALLVIAVSSAVLSVALSNWVDARNAPKAAPAGSIGSTSTSPPPPPAPVLKPYPEGPPTARAAGLAPNVIIITLDTTRADRLGSYGGDVETPTLDGVAAHGARFAHALASAPITAPSHASMFTGLDPNRHGVRENGTFVLDPSQVTLAEILSAAGWKTGAFIAGFPLSKRFGLGQGFDHYDDALSEDNPLPARSDLWQGIERPQADRPAGPVVRRAVRWIHETADVPFFAWIHLFDAHSPYRPPEPFASTYAGRPYEGEIAYMDAALAELFEALEAWQLVDDTLVVVVADHGESRGEHGRTGHGRYLYEPSLHVPLLFMYPGRIAGGQVIEPTVRTVDLTPTVLELLGLPVPDGLDGRSQAGILLGLGKVVRADAYAETLMPALRFGGPERYALVRGPWKLLSDKDGRGDVVEHLYDLKNDPGELDDRAKAEPEVLADMRAALDDRIARGEAGAVPAALDPATKATLRALGYVR